MNFEHPNLLLHRTLSFLCTYMHIQTCKYMNLALPDFFSSINKEDLKQSYILSH